MGPDPVPEPHRGVAFGHSIRCTGSRQTTFEEAFSKHRYYLTRSGILERKFHIARVPIHRDVSRDSDVQPISKNLVMPSSNCDGSEVALFPDETSHNLRFISGRFSLLAAMMAVPVCWSLRHVVILPLRSFLN